MGNEPNGFDADRIKMYISEIKKVHEMNVQIAIVIGGGNIYRGAKDNNLGIARTQGDYMGMLATIINGLALQSALGNIGIKCKLLSGIRIDPLCELTSSSKAIQHLEKNEIVIISGGTGNPYFTTDTAAVLRALEINADVILKGTRVDGVYTEDPEKNPLAKKYDTLTFEEAYEKSLGIMDMTAFTLCKDNKLPIIVFNMNTEGNLQKIINGESAGTLVTN